MMHGTMRTTITLDPDLEARLRRLAAERGSSFSATVNSVVRAGLEAGRESGSSTPYEERTVSLGVQPGVNLTKALQVASALEDEVTARELELRK